MTRRTSWALLLELGSFVLRIHARSFTSPPSEVQDSNGSSLPSSHNRLVKVGQGGGSISVPTFRPWTTTTGACNLGLCTPSAYPADSSQPCSHVSDRSAGQGLAKEGSIQMLAHSIRVCGESRRVVTWGAFLARRVFGSFMR